MNYEINNTEIQEKIAQTNSEAVIDKEAIRELWEDLDEDEDLIQEMVSLFLDDAPRQLLAAHQALANQDCKELGRIAHTLKGSSSYYGAKRLAKSCAELEVNCEGGNLLAADALLAQMEKEFAALREALNSILFQQLLLS